MTINTDNVLSMNVPQASTKPTLTSANILLQYIDVFTGQEKFVQELHLEVDEVVHPVQIPTRKVPLIMKSPIKQELDRLEGLGIIKPVSVSTNWVSSMVAATKRNGTIRLCYDPKLLH
jgi:hypothetical protein